MASIQSLGIGSGLLTTDLVDDLVAAERKNSDLRLDLQQAEYEAEISAFGAITSAIENLRVATDGLKDQSSLQSITATSNDDTALTATASSLASAGNYNIKINAIAETHSLVSQSYTAITDIVGTGELTIRFGTTSFAAGNGDYESFAVDTAKTSKTLIIDSSNNTLSSLRDAINTADFGVDATIVNDGGGFRLLLATDDPGLSNSMEVLVANDAGSGLKNFAFNSTYNDNVAVGAITEGGSVDLSSGLDFATTNANFTFTIGAFVGLVATVNQDATTDLGGGGGTAEDSRIAAQAAIDTALAGAGLAAGLVVASIDSADGGLILTTLNTGSNETLEITADDGVLGLNPNLGTRYGSDGSLTQTQAAASAQIEVNGLTISRESNLVTEVINGVTLNLKTADTSKTINLSLSSDAATIITKVETFVESYNELRVLTGELTVFDIDTGESGILLGDATLRSINSRIQNVMNSVVDGIVDSKFRTLSEVGIFSDQNNSFLLNVDSVALTKAVNENPDAILSLFATNSSATDAQVEVINTGINSQPGSYDVVLTQLATQGSYNGATNAALDNSILIDSDNDTFVVKVNGTTSNTITLTQQTYNTAALLAQELQLRINNDTAINAAGDTITVTYNAGSQRFDFLSSDYGSDSSISFSSTDTDVESELGFGAAVGTVNAGLDVKGTINGEAATGNGQFLRASEGSSAAKPGFVVGSVLASLNVPLTITSGELSNGDYNFKVSIDGIASGQISLSTGTYNTAPELATALQNAINADEILLAAGKSATVDFDLGLSAYGVISDTTGISSSLNFTELSTNMISQFGLAIGGGTQGTDATGELNEAAGIRVRILGGSIGSRGSVSYIEGTTFKLSSLFEEFLDVDGLLDVKVEGLNELLEGVADAKLALEERLEIFQNRLVSQFSSADLAISRLKNTEDFLTQQLELLSALFTNN
ncbi:MAG: flagellar filament capping protein FliD [Pseudomonadales bacterium]|nr:flagellar filament capping protein FliD [Pseudomonadales bacterium]